MDEAVEEVFQRMLERSCRTTAEALNAPPDYCACIKFSGALEAQCIVEFPAASARQLTRAFLGSATEWDEAIIADAVGELCNMIAGGWKKRLGAPCWEADLSVPSISRAPVHQTPAPCRSCLRRSYAFDDLPFVVSLATEKAAESLDPAAPKNPST